MKVLKTILIVILTIITVPLLVALFVKNDYAVEREIIINKPKKVVYDYVKYLKNQDNFSKWASMDPDMTKTFEGTDGQVGFVSAWESQKKEVGKGEQEIIKIVEGELIEYELRFQEPFSSNSPAFMSLQKISDTETKVVWGFKGHMDYPSNIMLLMMDFEKTIGDDLNSGLQNLKGILEK